MGLKWSLLRELNQSCTQLWICVGRGAFLRGHKKIKISSQITFPKQISHTDTHTDTCLIMAISHVVSFADDKPTSIRIIPRLSIVTLERLFYSDEELAEFRHEAFLEAAGLSSWTDDGDDDDKESDDDKEEETSKGNSRNEEKEENDNEVVATIKRQQSVRTRRSDVEASRQRRHLGVPTRTSKRGPMREDASIVGQIDESMECTDNERKYGSEYLQQKKQPEKRQKRSDRRCRRRGSSSTTITISTGAAAARRRNQNQYQRQRESGGVLVSSDPMSILQQVQQHDVELLLQQKEESNIPTVVSRRRSGNDRNVVDDEIDDERDDDDDDENNNINDDNHYIGGNDQNDDDNLLLDDARNRGYERPDDFLPLRPQKSPLKFFFEYDGITCSPRYDRKRTRQGMKLKQFGTGITVKGVLMVAPTAPVL